MDAYSIAQIATLARLTGQGLPGDPYHEYFSDDADLTGRKRSERQGGFFWMPLLAAAGMLGAPALKEIGTDAGKWIGHKVFGKRGRGILRMGERRDRRYGGWSLSGIKKSPAYGLYRRGRNYLQERSPAFDTIVKLIQQHGPEVLELIKDETQWRPAAKKLLTWSLDHGEAPLGRQLDNYVPWQFGSTFTKGARKYIKDRYGYGLPVGRLGKRFGMDLDFNHIPRTHLIY